MNALDTFCLTALKVITAATLMLAAVVYMPTSDFGKPVHLYHAQQAKAEACWKDDWVCELQHEQLAKARPPQGKGYSKRERNQMNNLIARLP